MIDNIYTEIITENARATHNRKALENPTAIKRGVNPSCGDDIQIQVQHDGTNVLDASFQGQGCAISQAATSMMIDLVKGKSLEEAKRLANLFLSLIQGADLSEAEMEELDESVALEGVSQMPARVKCATLPWHTLLETLEQL